MVGELRERTDEELCMPEFVVVSVVEGGAEEGSPDACLGDVCERLGDVQAYSGIREFNDDGIVVALGLSVVLGLGRGIHLDECERLVD